ncbi:hypothetical protein [Micromonospora psammae]|uniref:hypothetical protein n=1 Tax=Micromonospora sp. CPCC 205556 TaxID=3122398 RepID=UPI002FEFF2FF
MTHRDLETRYRRLLAVHPWEHRRVYEEEMLAVLLAGARPGQRRPSPAEAVDLVAAGLRARLRITARGLTDPAWSDASAVTGLVTGLMLLALAGHALVTQLTVDRRLPPPAVVAGADAVDWLRLLGWAGVCAAALLGWRRVAATLAATGVLAWAVLVAPQVTDNPGHVVDTLPQLLLAVVTAGALAVPAPRRRALEVLGARRLVVLAIAPLTMAAVLLLNRHTSPAFDNNTGPVTVHVLYGLEARTEVVLWLHVAALAGAALALLLALGTLTPPVRRRVVVLLMPVPALMMIIDTTLSGWMTSTLHMGHAIPLVPAQWALLVLVPPVTFLAGVLIVRRREETLRVLRLGRAADRERPAD